MSRREATPAARYHVAVDTGGTFTDLLTYDGVTGEIRVAKVPSTPAEPDAAIRRALAETGVSVTDVAYLGHSSTVALNTLLQRRGTSVGLITTAGFRDVLEIGRFSRPEIYNLFYRKPVALVPRERRHEVPERVDAQGRIIEPLDESAVVNAGAQLVRAGVRAIAICFLNAYINPVHEARAAHLLRVQYPGLHVAASHEFVREWREYERTSTTVLHAYLMEACQAYLAGLDGWLRRTGGKAPVLVTRSDGGLMAASAASKAPALTLMSGPAAAVQGAARIGAGAGVSNIITLDIGGTSTDVSLIRGGEPSIVHETVASGYPLMAPSVDVHSIGAGGGTVAWSDEANRLRVGPQSAGADPGPACYGRGGDRPTVTDAYVVLGLLAPDRFLGGRLPLDTERAHAAVSRLANQVGLTVERCAYGIVQIVNAQIAAALRLISVQRGHDPREFALLAMGGAGALHAPVVARELSIPRVLIPVRPAHLAAWGIMSADLRRSVSSTEPQRWEDVTAGWLAERIDHLVAELRRALATDGVKAARVWYRPVLEMRFVHQLQSVAIPCPRTPRPGSEDRLLQRFLRAYRRRYGDHAPGTPVELVTIRVEAVGKVAGVPVFPQVPAPPARSSRVRTRRAWLPHLSGWTDVPVYDRAQLAQGEIVSGPAIVEEDASTTLVLAGQRLRVDPSGNLEIVTVRDRWER